MLQCDLRIGEIETVILQFTEIAGRGLDGAEPDAETKARLDRSFSGRILQSNWKMVESGHSTVLDYTQSRAFYK